MAHVSRPLLFLENFDAAPPPPEPPAVIPDPEPVISAADLAAAREDGYRRGHAEAADAHAVAMARTMAAIASGLDGATEQARSAVEQSAMALSRLVMDTAAAACPALRGRFGAAEINRFLAILLPALAREPLVTISVHPSLAETASQLAREHGIRHDIVAAARVPPGDAKVDWGDGCAELRGADICAEVLEILQSLDLVPAPSGKPATASEG